MGLGFRFHGFSGLGREREWSRPTLRLQVRTSQEGLGCMFTTRSFMNQGSADCSVIIVPLGSPSS